MKKEFKYPCAVETDSLVGNQGNELQEAFIKLGAYLYDEYRAWTYYGVDIGGDTQFYKDLHSFAIDEDEEVILYTYEEIMSFVAELEQPEETPNTETSDEPQFKVVCNQTYTLTIKGNTFELTSDEFTELERAMEGF